MASFVLVMSTSLLPEKYIILVLHEFLHNEMGWYATCSVFMMIIGIYFIVKTLQLRNDCCFQCQASFVTSVQGP